MARGCQICGGLIFAANEIVGYSGPICSGMHNQTINDNSYLLMRIIELEKRVAELSQQDTPRPLAKKKSSKIAKRKP